MTPPSPPLVQIETYFNKTGKLINYWIGLEKQGTLFMWADGGTAGSGSTSDANPYAHFSYDFLETLSATPTYTHYGFRGGV